jgi:hypothetical protein
MSFHFSAICFISASAARAESSTLTSAFTARANILGIKNVLKASIHAGVTNPGVMRHQSLAGPERKPVPFLAYFDHSPMGACCGRSFDRHWTVVQTSRIVVGSSLERQICSACRADEPFWRDA